MKEMQLSDVRRRALLLVTLFLATPAGLLARAKIEKREVTSEGRSRTYYRFVPERPAGAPPAPLLITLHGSGADGRSLVEKWRALAQREGIVIAGPDATVRQAWNTATDGPVFFHDLVQDLRAALPIDARRIYLFGHSAGAVLTFFLASLESEYFAAAVSNAGSLPAEHESVLAYATRKVPILLVVGSQDPYFPVPVVEATREVLAARGFPVEMRVIPHHTHAYYQRSREINGISWAFLSRQALAAEPKYRSYPR
jgi:poly(3-hydroxybutyrate) depolymerase